MSLPLEVEAWIWYPLVILVVLGRYVSRFMQVKSIRKFQAEDWVMMVVACLYTAEIVFLIRISDTPTNLIPPGQYDPNDTEGNALRVYGSKLIVALEMVYCAAIWGCKVCLLFFYANMTFSLPVSYIWTKLVACYVVIGYIVMVSLYFGVWCQPFYNYWSVPAANDQCSTAENHLILNCVLNISSDLMIMFIPLPLLIRTNLPLRKKLALCAVFSLGAFVILSAVLNKYYSFEHPYGSEWVYWYTREISTAMVVANIPHLWALFRRAFKLRSFINNDTSSNRALDDIAKPPPRYFEEFDNPLSPKRSRNGTGLESIESVDIDKVLAEVERDAGYLQQPEPFRFRSVHESEMSVEPHRASTHLNRSLEPKFNLQPPTPATPYSYSSEMRLLPSPPRTPRSGPSPESAWPPGSSASNPKVTTLRFDSSRF